MISDENQTLDHLPQIIIPDQNQTLDHLPRIMIPDQNQTQDHSTSSLVKIMRGESGLHGSAFG